MFNKTILLTTLGLLLLSSCYSQDPQPAAGFNASNLLNVTWYEVYFGDKWDNVSAPDPIYGCTVDRFTGLANGSLTFQAAYSFPEDDNSTAIEVLTPTSDPSVWSTSLG